MNRFRQVCGILDTAVGGPGAGVAFHGAFWRGVTRDEFVGLSVFGRQLLVVGDATASNLVRALRGQAPFGADLPVPPAGAQLNRMPSGLDPVPEESIAVVEAWITDGCLDEDVPPPLPVWRPTAAPEASSHTDDIWFTDPRRGWAVNSNGQILHTEDGFATWTEHLHDPDGTAQGAAPVRDVRRRAAVLKTTDGGDTWTRLDIHDPQGNANTQARARQGQPARAAAPGRHLAGHHDHRGQRRRRRHDED